MPVLKCKMCGGNLHIEEGQTVCECEYCGTRQTIPSVDDEKKLNLYNRANRLRSNNEFDKAYGVFESLVADFPEEAEAYWGLCLCKYGIEYVDDPLTGKKIPTCHRTSYESIFDDNNFEMALEYADGAARGIYREEAKEIDRLQKAILEIAKNEEPFDVFICYKETDEYGDRTIDSVIAQDVYTALTEKGYKVFFSRITLEDKLGTAYEPYIFAALNSAKVMLAFGTSYDYYNAVWVKNEWSRYLDLMKKDKNKYLIPCYKGIDAYDMPREFSHLQAQDMGKVGALQDLLRGIEKIIPREQKKTEIETVVQTGVTNTGALLKRAYMFLEEKDNRKAREYFEKVLDTDPECAQAYIGRLLLDYNAHNITELMNRKTVLTDLDSNVNVVRISQFGNEEEKKIIVELKKLNETLKKEKKEQERLEKERKHKEARVARIKEKQEYNLKLFNKLKELVDEKKHHKNAQTLIAAYNLSREFDYFPESKTIREDCLNYAQILISNNNSEINQIEEKISQEASKTLGEQTYKSELEFIEGRLERLKNTESELKTQLGKLGFFDGKKKKELAERIADNTVDSTNAKKELVEVKDKLSVIKQAQDTINSLDKHKDSLIKENVYISESIIATGDKEALIGLGKSEVRKNMFLLAINAGEVNDTVFLGEYKQNSDKKEPVEWIILAKDDNKALLLSCKGIDSHKYHHTKENIDWNKSAIRNWMNETLIYDLFSELERSMIISAYVKNKGNPDYRSFGGDDTSDRLFLLSIDELKQYFNCDPTLTQCEGTQYAYKQGAIKNSSGKCWWWLRTPGCDNQHAATGDSLSGNFVNNAFGAVRPALWVRIN